MDDAELVGLMKAGDNDALRELMELHGGCLLYSARLLLKDARDAEEAVSDTFWKAFAHADTYRGEGSVRAWLMTICRNCCSERKRRRRLQLVSYDETHLNGKERRVQEGCGQEVPELRADFEKALQALPQRQREVVVLVDVAGLSYTEAATALGAPPTTVASRHKAAMRCLAETMKDWNPRREDEA